MDLWRQGFISLCFAPLHRPLGPSVILGKSHGAAAAAGPRLHCRMVGRCSKQDLKTGMQTFQWNTNIYCVELVEGEE